MHAAEVIGIANGSTGFQNHQNMLRCAQESPPLRRVAKLEPCARYEGQPTCALRGLFSMQACRVAVLAVVRQMFRVRIEVRLIFLDPHMQSSNREAALGWSLREPPLECSACYVEVCAQHQKDNF